MEERVRMLEDQKATLSRMVEEARQRSIVIVEDMTR